MASQNALIEELRSSGEKSTRNVDAIRRSLVLDIFSILRPASSILVSTSDSEATKESLETIETEDAHAITSSTFVKRLRKWVWIIGWSVQSHVVESPINGSSMDISDEIPNQTKKGAVISMAKAWQCIEECFECLPLSATVTWFEWLISEEWMQSGSEVKVPASELGVPLRFFRALLMRVSYATSNARTAVAQPHRLANLAGLILSYASSILPLCHASGLNRKSLINSSRKTPIIIPDSTEIYSYDDKESHNKENGTSTSSKSSKPYGHSTGSSQRSSIFDSVGPLLKACHAASTHVQVPQSAPQKSSQRGPRESQRPSNSSLTKSNYDLLWDFVSRISVLSGKMSDPKDSLRIDSNLTDFDSQLQKVLPIIINYETNDKASSMENNLTTSPHLDSESTRSNLASLTTSYVHSPNSVPSFLSPTALQSSTFLTLPFATHLQLLQPAFRLQIIVHILIFLHSLKKPSAAPIAGAKPSTDRVLTTEGTNILNGIIKRVESALSTVLQKTLNTSSSASTTFSASTTSTTAFLMSQAVLSFMDSESKYVDWKVANCPDFELPLPSSSRSTSVDSDAAMQVDSASGQERTASKKRKIPFWSTPLSGEPVMPGVLQSIAITTTNLDSLHQSLKEFITATKKRKEAPLRDGFVGCDGDSFSTRGPKLNLGAPALTALFNSPPTETSGMPTLDDALGEIPTPASTWRSRRVIRYRDNLSAYTGLCLSSRNRDGEPFDLASFVSASNRNFPSPLFVPPAPPTPPPEPEPLPEPDLAPTASDTAAETVVIAEGAGIEGVEQSESNEPLASASEAMEENEAENESKEVMEEDVVPPPAEDDDGLGNLFVEE